MQVDPKPSPWPCVAMLVGLLVFCLTVPHYWQDVADDALDQAEPSESSTDAAYAAGLVVTAYGPGVPHSLASIGNDALGLPVGSVPNAGLLTLYPTPTIEELVESARLGSSWHDAGTRLGERYAMSWSPTAASPMNFTPPRYQSGRVDGSSDAASPMIAAAIERAGQFMAAYSAAEALPKLVSRAVAWYQSQFRVATKHESPGPVASTWRLVTPDTESAVQPPAPATQPVLRIPLGEPVPEVESQRVADADPWCVPQVLYEQLERLACHPYSAAWAQTTIEQLHTITQRDPENSEVPILLLDLSRSAYEAAKMAEATAEDRVRVELLRAHWGLARRLDCWTLMHDIRVARRTGIRIASRGSLNNLLGDSPGQSDENEAALTADLETYELSRDPDVGRQVAEQRETLENSANSLEQSLADAVERHYRNANVRVAITAELLNRLIGGERSEVRPVRDRIAGTPVRGESQTVSQSRVRLEPAAGRWHLDVEAQGLVESNTLANGGRARLRSFGATDFTAQKTVVVDADGVHLEATSVDAMNYSRLAGVTTDFDWVPLLNSYARSRAVQEYRARRPRAKAEVEFKVAAQAVEAMDRETRQAVQRVRQDVHDRLTGPMAEFGIELTPIELTTTQERIVARLRVAGDRQLGAHTPRPRALSDSLASVQVHESALTNAAVSLALDGARYTAAELQAALREKFPRFAAEHPPEASDDTVFEFAYRDAVQFRIDDGRLEVLLSLANFEHEGRSTRDFIVHAFYSPVIEGLNAELVRDGALGIEGRLSAAERARLHNAFKRVLSEDRRLPIVRLPGADDPRLDGLMITQMVLEDGWAGVAIGPQTANRVAERSRSLR